MLPVINYPTFSFVLPSENKPLKFRPFVTKEEKILLMAKESGDVVTILDTIKQILQTCLVDSYNVEDMTNFDIEYFFIKLRAVSVGNIIDLAFQDLEDKKQYTFQVDLNLVEIAKNPEHTNIVQINDQLKLKLKYPKIIFDHEVLNSKTKTEAIYNIVKKSIDYIYDSENIWKLSEYPSEDIDKFLDNLSVPAFESIQKFMATMPKLSYTINYKNSLGHERQIVLETLTDFFTLV